MAREVTDPRGEPSTIILLNRQSIQLPSIYLSLYLETSIVFISQQRNPFLHWIEIDTEPPMIKDTKWLWSAHPKIGHLYHTPYKAQGIFQMRGMTVVVPVSSGHDRQLHLRTLNSCSCSHKTYTDKCSQYLSMNGRGSQAPSLTEKLQAADHNRGRNSVFFRSGTSDRFPVQSTVLYPYLYVGSKRERAIWEELEVWVRSQFDQN